MIHRALCVCLVFQRVMRVTHISYLRACDGEKRVNNKQQAYSLLMGFLSRERRDWHVERWQKLDQNDKISHTKALTHKRNDKYSDLTWKAWDSQLNEIMCDSCVHLLFISTSKKQSSIGAWNSCGNSIPGKDISDAGCWSIITCTSLAFFPNTSIE